MMNIGIVGLGHLGKIHLKLLKEIPYYRVNGIYDIDEAITHELAVKYKTKVYKDYASLLSNIEAVCIVTPTPSHFEIASKAIKAGKHVFIEKPSTIDPAETKTLIKLAHEAGVYVQVGHVERYNPAFIAIKEYIKEPLFLEIQRLALYNTRGTDVSVVLDLMIHDIDLVLHLVKSKVKRISASGSLIVSKTPDIANVRIEFENGCVASFIANRAAVANRRTIDVFQRNAYLSMDFLNKTATINKIELGNGSCTIVNSQLEVISSNSIKQELEDFYNSIIDQKPVSVSLQDAEAALIVAQEIDLQIST